jgi:allantoicase
MELGTTGRIEEVVVDTAHFKGNYPDRCFLQGVAEANGTPEEMAAQAESWPVLLPEQKLSADNIHTFRDELADLGPIRFVRLNIIPDGGVSRLRLLGRVAP